MKRNNTMKWIGGAAMIFTGLGLFSCSSDEIDAPKGGADLDSYITLSITAPETRADDQEEGSEPENSIANNSMSVFFIGDDNSVAFTISGETPVKTATGYTLRHKMKASEFAQIVKGKSLRVVVTANQNLTSLQSIDQPFAYSSIIAYGQNGVNVPMVSTTPSGKIAFDADAKEIEKKFVQADESSTVYDLSANGFGTIELERNLSRIDYKDKDNNPVANVYALANTGLYLKVTGLLPVNVHNASYLFKHTSPDANQNVWVNDIDWTEKTAALTSGKGYIDGKFINATGQNGDLSNYSFTDVAALTSNNILAKDGIYHPWVYVSENTLPSVEAMIEGLSTGVVFRVMLCKNAQGEAWKAGDAQVAEANIDAAAKTITVRGSQRNLIADAGNLYLDYYYWIRHENNNDPNEMGPMEFGVVRNTIYKLSIKSFNSLPRVYDPNDPDELPQAAVEVNVRVTPWGYFRIPADI